MDNRKSILFITLLVVILISSGCINQKNNLTNQINNQSSQNNSGNNPTQTSTTLPEKQPLPDLLEKVQPSVVAIYSRDFNKKSTNFNEMAGSGFFISEDEIITNYHVIENAYDNSNKKNKYARVIVKTFDKKSYLADIIKVGNFDEGLDLAILKLADEEILEIYLEKFETIKSFRKFQPLILSDTHRQGDEVIAIGNSLGIYPNSVSEGIVSNTVKENNIIYVQHTASINPGNSGGPLLNYNGAVIGINTWKITDAEGMSFAISSSDITGFLNSRDNEIIDKQDSPDEEVLQEPPPTTPQILDSCQSLGCPSGTSVVGSVNSNLYYDCSCPAVNRIYPENLICFKTISDAKNYGYRQATK